MPGAVVLRGAAGSQEVGRSSRVAACELTVVDPEVGLPCFVARFRGPYRARARLRQDRGRGKAEWGLLCVVVRD